MMKAPSLFVLVFLLGSCAQAPGEFQSGEIDPQPASECYPKVRSCAERRLTAALDPSASTPIDEAFVRSIIDECAGVHVTEATPLLNETDLFRDDDYFTYSVEVPGPGLVRVKLEASSEDQEPIRGRVDVWHGTLLLENADCRVRLDGSGAAECQTEAAGPATYYLQVAGTAHVRYSLSVTLEPKTPAAE